MVNQIALFFTYFTCIKRTIVSLSDWVIKASLVLTKPINLKCMRNQKQRDGTPAAGRALRSTAVRPGLPKLPMRISYFQFSSFNRKANKIANMYMGHASFIGYEMKLDLIYISTYSFNFHKIKVYISLEAQF